ncbi:MAG: bifunctional demethylmenaquinone methyltransferase/2-methoxy-6-polyprenyl-1,4-benzoquinol methylase UbiE [Pseudomonadota bacterium]
MSNERTGTDDAMKRTFGFTEVAEGEKQEKVNDVFHGVAKRYDIMNDLMSVGLHRAWKDAMVSTLAPSKTRPFHSIDVAGGTGDIAFRIVERSGGNAHVTVLDINASMLEVGEERALKRNLQSNVDFVEGNAEELPQADKTFDAYTIATGIRNVPDINKALREAYRVLKRGGRFLCLEFSETDVPGFGEIYDAWSFNVMPRIGKVVAGDDEPYKYLVESIRKFPNQADFAAMIENAGFKRVTYRNYSGGAVALHSGWKL